jgi:hypothetical protein
LLFAEVADRARNGDDDEVDVQRLFERFAVLEFAHEQAPPLDGGEGLGNIAAMVAVAVVRAAPDPAARVEKWQLAWAVRELLTAASHALPALESGLDTAHDTLDHQAADRSAAVGLPLVLAETRLCEVADVGAPEVLAGIVRVAGSAYIEVRRALCGTFTWLWAHVPCTGGGDTLHTGSLDALEEMVATAGLTPNDGVDAPRRPQRLTPPVELTLTSGSPVLDLLLAADVVSAAQAAAASPCPYGERARTLAEALAEHDLLTWTRQPRPLAARAEAWRHSHDTVTAAAALRRDRRRLDACLDSFATDPDTLAGLLRRLVFQAVSAQEVEQLIALWPGLLDRFGGTRSRNLRQALLPVPVQGVVWPSAATRRITAVWASLCSGEPGLSDHLIAVVDAHSLFGAQEIAQVLDVLGEEPTAVARASHSAVEFLVRVLADGIHRTGPSGPRARRLLDALAAHGLQDALNAQRAIEDAT